MTREARSIRCPESVLGWIPWYGEIDHEGGPLLDPRQRGAVESHASECADCRAELDMIAGAPYEIDVDLPDPDRVFHEIKARIDAGEAEGLETAPSHPLPSSLTPLHALPSLAEEVASPARSTSSHLTDDDRSRVC